MFDYIDGKLSVPFLLVLPDEGERDADDDWSC